MTRGEDNWDDNNNDLGFIGGISLDEPQLNGRASRWRSTPPASSPTPAPTSARSSAWSFSRSSASAGST